MITSVLSEQVTDGILVRRFRFSSFEGSDNGTIRSNEVYAVLAQPTSSGTGKRPGILVCHGGYGAAEEYKAITWAKLGFIALAPEIPGYAAPETFQGISRVIGRPYGSQLFATSPDALACSLFDSVVAGLGAFNYLASREEVDPRQICITGASFGGYMATMLCGLLDARVLRAFSLYGTGFFLDDTTWTAELMAKPQRERDLWMGNFDAGTRIARVRATYLLYEASNDAFFRPPSALKTFDRILSDKYLCFAPGDNHDFSLPGGTRDGNGEVWAGAEPAYFLQGNAATNGLWRLPKISVMGRQGRTMIMDLRGRPSAVEAWGYYSTDLSAPWTTRHWSKLNAAEQCGMYVLTLPPSVSACDWFGGVSFQSTVGQVVRRMSLSTTIYRENIAEDSQICRTAPPGLVSWWRGAGNGNDTVGANKGTLHGGASYAPGKVGQGFSFDGNGANVDFGSSAGNFGTNDFTIEFWMKTTSITNQDILCKRPVCGHSSFWHIVMRGVPSIVVDQNAAGTGFGRVTATTAVNDGAFHHVAFTREGVTLRAYVDGAMNSSTTLLAVASISNSVPMYAGWSVCQSAGTTHAFNGVLDEISLYNRALASSEIEATYRAGVEGKCLTPVYITSIKRFGTNIELAWLAQPRVVYRVQFKTNLTDTTWKVLGDLPAVATCASKTDTTLGTARQRFYRIKLLQ